MINKSVITIGLFLVLGSFLYGQIWESYTTENSNIPSDEVLAVAVDINGNKWVGTTSGLAKLSGGQWTVYTISNSGLPSNYVRSLAISPTTGFLWIGTNNGLARYDRISQGQTNGGDWRGWVVYNRTNSALPNNVVESLAIDYNGVVWAGTLGNGGLARFTGGNWTIYTSGNSDLPNNYIYALEVSAQNKLWIGTNGGLAQYFGGIWQVHRTDNSGLRDNAIRSIATFNDNDVVVGTSGGGMVIIEDDDWVVLHLGNFLLPSNSLSAVATEGNGVYWIGSSDDGFARINNWSSTLFREFNSQLINNQIKAITVDNNAVKWIGTLGGLMSLNEIAVTGVTIEPDTVIIGHGDSIQLTATVIPENATDKEVNWLSDNEEIATVTDSGYVTTHLPGDVIIRVVTNDGSRTGTAYLNVTGKVSDPYLTPPGGSYEQPLQVTIKSDTDKTAIYYSVDGSDPTEESLLYTEPIPISEVTTIKTVAYREHWEKSNIVTAIYNLDTGINDDEIAPKALQVSVYPNPFSLSNSPDNLEYVSINYQAGENEEIKITIYDIRGRKVRNYQHFARSTGENTISVPLVAADYRLVPGVYLYTVESQESSVSGKFSIIK